MVIIFSPVTGLSSLVLLLNQRRSPPLNFKFQTAVLPVLCVTFQVQLSFVVTLVNVFLVWLPNFSLQLLFLSVLKRALFYHEGGGNRFHRNVGTIDYTA